METIHIAKSDEELAGTNLMLTTMQILAEKGIGDPGDFEMDNTGEVVIIMRMTSEEAAQALRDELPKRGHPVLTPSRPDSIPGVH